MSSLKHNQEAFLKLISTPEDMNQVLADNPGLDHQIADSEKFSTAQRINIYSTAYYLRILETMKQNYPQLLIKMGEDEFSTLIGDYILAHPPHHYSLNYVDQYFVGFVGCSVVEYSTIENSELADIALFEKKELESFFSKDSESMTLSDLERIPQDDWMSLELNLIPSCRLVEFSRDNDKYVLFFRPVLDVEYRIIDQTQAILLKQLQSNPKFDLLCEKAAELSSADEAVTLIGKYLVTWINDGIFVRE